MRHGVAETARRHGAGLHGSFVQNPLRSLAEGAHKAGVARDGATDVHSNLISIDNRGSAAVATHVLEARAGRGWRSGVQVPAQRRDAAKESAPGATAR